MSKHPLSHTFYYLEDWQNRAKTEAPFVHEESGTLLGGDSGLPWIIRALIMLVLNLAVAKGIIEPTVPIPEHYDISRLPIGEYERVITWCQQWLARIEASSAILDQTFEARTSEEFTMSASEFAACAQREEEEQLTEQGGLDQGTEEGEAAATEPRKRKPKQLAKSTKGKTAKVSKGKKKAKNQDEDEDEPEVDHPEEGSSNGDPDFEARDPSPPGSETSEQEELEGEEYEGVEGEGQEQDGTIGWADYDEEMDVPVKREFLLRISCLISIQSAHICHYYQVSR